MSKKLNKLENRTVRNEIIKYLGERKVKVPTEKLIRRVFENVKSEIEDCKLCHVSGLVSGMTSEGEIYCSNGMCWR